MADWRSRDFKYVKTLQAVGIAAILTALVASVTYRADIQNGYSLYRAQRFIRTAQGQTRTTLGRISGAPYAPFDNAGKPALDDLSRAQLLLLRLPNSAEAEYLQSLIYIGSRN